MANDNNKTHADYLKELGRGVIKEADLEEYDEVCDNNGNGLIGYECITNALAVCRIMLDETVPVEERRRKAYDEFNSQDHNGSTASWVMSFIRRFCNDGDKVADEIKNFKYDRRMTPEEIRAEVIRMEREYEEMMTEKQKRKVKGYEAHNDRLGITSKGDICTTNGPMFLVDLPYRFDIDECLNIVQQIGKELGMCYGIFNGVPMFSFDDKHTFFRRQQNGLTEEDYAEFIDALRCSIRDDNADREKASKILKERTWQHLGKTL